MRLRVGVERYVYGVLPYVKFTIITCPRGYVPILDTECGVLSRRLVREKLQEM